MSKFGFYQVGAKDKSGQTNTPSRNLSKKKPTNQKSKFGFYRVGQDVDYSKPTVVPPKQPTVAGQLVRGIVKPFAEVATNVANIPAAARGEDKWVTPFSGDYLGEVKGLGKVDVTKSPFEKENLKTIKKSAGTGLEIGSMLGYGGAGKTVTSGLFKQGVKNFAKTQGVKLLKEGALTGAAYSTGSQMRENADTGEKFSGKRLLTDTALSTVLTPVAGFALNKVLGKNLPKLLRKNQVKDLLKKDNWALITGTREIVGDASHPINVTSNKKLEEELVAQYGRKNVVRVEGKYNNVNQGDSFFVNGMDENSAKNYGTKYGQDTVLTKDGFVASDGSFIEPATGIKTGKEALKEPGYTTLPSGETMSVDIGERQLTPKPAIEMPGKIYVPPQLEAPKIQLPAPGILESMEKIRVSGQEPTPFIPKKTPSSNLINKGLNQKEIPNQPKIDPGQAEIPKMNNWSTIKQTKPENITKDVSSIADEIEGFDEGTLKQWSSDIRNLDMDEVTRVALGGKKTIPNTIPANAYLSVAKNIANETGDLDLAQRLSTSSVKSKTAQGLVASKITASDNIVDDLIEIKQARMQKSGISTERFEKESMELMKKLKTKIEEIKKIKPTTKEVIDIINNLICK